MPSPAAARRSARTGGRNTPDAGVQPPPLLVVGAGAAGTAIARAAQAAGLPVEALACRTLARARERVALAGAGRPLDLEGLLAQGAPGPALLLLGVPDRAIAPVAARLAGRAWAPGSVALHLSGSVEVQALDPLRARGVALGACHPLKSFVDPRRDAASMAGTVAALEGDPAALQAAGALAQALGWRPFTLAPGARAAWHAGAAHAANHLVALLDQSLDLLERAGLARDAGRAALLPLLRGTLDNLAAHAPAEALTGPVARGDAEVLRRHVAALRDAAPDVRAAYGALATRALALARQRGLPPAVLAELRAALEGAGA